MSDDTRIVFLICATILFIVAVGSLLVVVAIWVFDADRAVFDLLR